nr:hypothetical protein [Tanacetum cinerariifolium]
MEESLCLQNYVEAMKDEEKLLYQKAKNKWLSFGDRNNAFFHKVLKGRVNKSITNFVKDCQGILYQGSDVADQFVKHFQDFLGKAADVNDCEAVVSLIIKKISFEKDSFMIRNIEDNEVKEAMFQIDDNKALGPDKVLGVYSERIWFHARMVHWIMRCVTIVAFSICVNGKSCGYFNGGRGLRQGDPMSPYLFTLTVIRDINKVLKNFLWNQGDLSKGKAKVAWKSIYLNGLVTNNFESSGCDCTLLVVFPIQLGLGRELD